MKINLLMNTIILGFTFVSGITASIKINKGNKRITVNNQGVSGDVIQGTSGNVTINNFGGKGFSVTQRNNNVRIKFTGEKNVYINGAFIQGNQEEQVLNEDQRKNQINIGDLNLCENGNRLCIDFSNTDKTIYINDQQIYPIVPAGSEENLQKPGFSVDMSLL